MDDTVNRCARHLAVLAFGACMFGAHAGPLPDPTRPPPGLYQGSGDASHLGPQLQSILIASGGRQVAVIDGQTVRLGELFRGARVVRMTETSVTLARGSQHQVLRLPATGVPATGTPAAGAPAAGTPGAAGQP